MLRTWLVFSFGNFCYLQATERDNGGLVDNGGEAPGEMQLKLKFLLYVSIDAVA
jgi:hypothetical protein